MKKPQTSNLEKVKICKSPNLSVTIFKHKILAWGMTELSPAATLTPDFDLIDGSCGLLLPNTEAKVVSLDTGESLGPNERGELAIKGPQVN